MTQNLAYEVVDVFTDRAFAGNPLAVVLDADELSTSQLQSIAREFNLSETSFPMKPDVDGADYRLRIFTPGQELPFAGHPAIGASDVMLRRGRVAPGRVVQSCGAGLLALEVAADSVTLTGGTPSWSEPLDAEGLLVAVGLKPADLAGAPRRASCGLEFTFLPVVRDALARRRRPSSSRVVRRRRRERVRVGRHVGARPRVRRRRRRARGPGDRFRRRCTRRLPRALGSRRRRRRDAVRRRTRRGDGPAVDAALRCRRAGRQAESRRGSSGSTVPVAHGEIRIPDAR